MAVVAPLAVAVRAAVVVALLEAASSAAVEVAKMGAEKAVAAQGKPQSENRLSASSGCRRLRSTARQTGHSKGTMRWWGVVPTSS